MRPQIVHRKMEMLTGFLTLDVTGRSPQGGLKQNTQLRY
jgi:hypothetical protein